MNLRSSLTVCSLLVLLLSSGPTYSSTLRGFGTVTESKLPDGTGVEFQCDSPAHAVLLIEKLAHDVAQSATVPSLWTTAQISGSSVPILVRPGQAAFLVLAHGSDAYCFTATLQSGQDTSDLSSQFASAAPLIAGSQLYDATYKYPVYLDKWSSTGIGSWYTPYDPFNDDPPGLKDIVTPHFDYVKANGLTIHIGDDLARREIDSFIQKNQTPYHMSIWHEWDPDIARLDPFDLIQPGKLFTGYSDYYTGISFGGDKLQQYRDWKIQKLFQKYVNDPLLVDWDEPHGEIGPQVYQAYNDFGPRNTAHFVKWLQNSQGYTLTSLGQAWHHNSSYFKSWSDVPFPLDYSFFGADKDSLFADRTWHIHTAERAEGVSLGYVQNQFDDTLWPSLQMPGGELAALPVAIHKRVWYRGTFTVSAAYLAAHKGPMYLDVASFSQAGGPSNPDYVWFNETDLGGLSSAGGYAMLGYKDISGLVHAGVNHIAYCPASDMIPGTFFLSDKPMPVYPTSDSAINARYVDWSMYISACALEEETHTIQTIRGTDPNRMIKIMAAGPRDIFNPMMAQYGAYLHNTGDEAFFVPWDKRLSYPYGLRASAEMSGSVLDPFYFKQWLGWFTFSGLNAFDNFIDIEAMMYSKVTPYWKENFPYLHLANRYNMRKPEIGLLWSTKNSSLNTGGKGAIPLVYDLGRGDLQSIGYSYAYFDEPGLHSNLEKGYKVLWDEGTWAMSTQTVQDIKRFCEDGGTFVALQETGRHTFTQRDAWPLEALSGFKVKQVRPMGGFVSILDDQPVFTKLKGKNFLNEGKGIDYSGYNFADACTVLQPDTPDAQAVARYRDGTIAIGTRKVGKGRIIVLGSPFWRDSYDNRGMWWPGAGQNAFINDLLTTAGLPPDVPATTDKVWRDRYISDNGTEEYLILFNPNATDTQTFTTDWTASFPFTAVYDPKTGESVPATIDGSTAHLSITMQPMETKILAVQSERPGADVVSDWYSDLATAWKGSAPGHVATRPDLPFYYASFSDGAGTVVDTASVTPDYLSQLSSPTYATSGWDLPLGMVRPTYAGYTPTSTQSVVYRSVVDLPPSWKPGDNYRLRMNHYQDFGASIYLNGQQVGTGRDMNSHREIGLDVSSALHFPGPNVLVIVADQTGFEGRPDIWRLPAALASISYAGQWKLRVDEDHAPTTVSLPGDINGMWATKSEVVPTSWKGSHVFLHMDWGYSAPGRVAINDKVFFYEGSPTKYMDVTPWIRFGQPNQVLIQTSGSSNSWVPSTVTILSVNLEKVDNL